MTVQNQYAPQIYDYDGVTTEYLFAFEILGAEPLEVWFETETETAGVYSRQQLTANQYELILNSGYPVSVGGGVRITTTIPITVDRISIERNTRIDQNVDLKNFAPFQMTMLEYILDRLTMIVQEKIATRCGVQEETQPLQEIRFEPYAPLTERMVNDPLELIAFWCAYIRTNAQDCTTTGGEGGSPPPIVYEPGVPDVPVVWQESLDYAIRPWDTHKRILIVGDNNSMLWCANGHSQLSFTDDNFATVSTYTIPTKDHGGGVDPFDFAPLRFAYYDGTYHLIVGDRNSGAPLRMSDYYTSGDGTTWDSDTGSERAMWGLYVDDTGLYRNWSVESPSGLVAVNSKEGTGGTYSFISARDLCYGITPASGSMVYIVKKDASFAHNWVITRIPHNLDRDDPSTYSIAPASFGQSEMSPNIMATDGNNTLFYVNDISDTLGDDPPRSRYLYGYDYVDIEPDLPGGEQRTDAVIYFGQSVSTPLLTYGSGLFMAVAVPDADTSKLLIYTSSVIGGAYTLAKEVQLQYYVGASGINIAVEHWGGGWWVVGYKGLDDPGDFFGHFTIEKFQL